MNSLIFAVKDLFKNYFNWHGRLSRKGYWLAWLGVVLVSFALGLLANFVSDAFSMLEGLWALVTLLPMLFAAMRRFHDSGKPGWLAAVFYIANSALAILALVMFGVLLFAAMPDIGAEESFLFGLLSGSIGFLLFWAVISVTNFVFLVLPGKEGENKYGAPRPFDPNEAV